MTYQQTMSIGFDIIKLLNDNEKNLTSAQLRVLIFLFVNGRHRHIALGSIVNDCGLASGQHRSTGGSIVASLESSVP